jgi:hypothetical protein
MFKLPPHMIAISKAKEVAQLWMKYLGGYLEGCPTIYDDRVPTMGVDCDGRLYINPEWANKWAVEQNAYVLLHEMCHNMLNHAERRAVCIPDPTPEQLEKWNEAADMSIQQILEEWDKHRPLPSVAIGNPEYRNIPGMFRDLSTERYYGLLWNNGNPLPPPPGGQPGPQGQPGQPGQGQGNQPSQPANQPGQQPSQGQGNQPGQSGQQPGQPGNQPGQGGQPTNQPGNGSGAPGSGGQGGTKQPHTKSGSASDGIKQDYELESDLGSLAGNLARLEEVREQMAKDEEDNGGPGLGKGMGRLSQSLNVRLRRQPDPYDQLKSIVGKETSTVVGVDEFTFRKLGRMQQHDNFPVRGVIKMHPECVIVLDTSGSMGHGSTGERVSRALTAIAQGVRRLRNPRVISWDDGLQADGRCAAIKDFNWCGGGGTSMEKAIEYADQKYRPDCIVIVTDCGTHWPAKPTRARLVIAAVANDCAPPKWARYVDLTKEAPGYVG